MTDLEAHYNPLTGEVVGKNKLIRLHETRHSQQPKRLYLIMSYWIFGIITLMAIVTIVTTGQAGNWWFYPVFLPPFIWAMTMEIDAWIYAIKKRGEKP